MSELTQVTAGTPSSRLRSSKADQTESAAGAASIIVQDRAPRRCATETLSLIVPQSPPTSAKERPETTAAK